VNNFAVRICGLGLFLALLGMAGPAAAALSGPVRTQSGLLAGVAGRDPSITVFKGVPFAAPPVGALRWQPPQPVAPWSGVRKADAFGPLCPQAGPPERMSEDCLHLNVWTGAASGAEKRPVFVWIYGGAFIEGTGANPQFDGEALAKKGVVVVTFNYRLGALGFLATPELSAESGHKTSGNYGLLDDIAVLKWVRQNIAAFGGDPGRVTIGGQSAGAGSVGFLAQSPLAKGLFHRAIAQSHSRHPGDPELRFLSVSWRPLKSAEAAGAAYVESHGAKTIAEFRARPWQKVIENSNLPDMAVDAKSGAKPPIFRPVVDGYVIPASYSETLGKGAQNHVHVLTGNNKDETGAVPETNFERLRASTAPPRAGAPQANVRLSSLLESAGRKYGPMADEFLKLYPAVDDQQAALASNAAARDTSRSSTFLWASLWTRTVKQPVYTYWWTHAPPGPSHDVAGAFHGSEIPYVFNNVSSPDRPWTDDDRRIGEMVSSYWANYIKTGNPNGPGLPAWPAYDARIPRVMELGDNFGPISVTDSVRLGFWKRFFESQDQW
jgi:para-nitrobenzyl esterase